VIDLDAISTSAVNSTFLWLDRWLAMKAEDLEETTIYSYRITLDRVRGRLGNIRLQDLTEEHVEGAQGRAED
jgi:hypothetical protein